MGVTLLQQCPVCATVDFKVSVGSCGVSGRELKTLTGVESE
jgi:hypothetical protein